MKTSTAVEAKAAPAAEPKKRRERGRGHIFRPKFKAKDGQKRECPNWWIKYYRYGKAHYENTHSDKKTVAERLVRKRLGEIEVGVFVGPRVERVYFESLAEDLCDNYRNKKNRSLGRLEKSISHLSHFFGNMRAVEIGSDLIEKYKKLRQKNPGDEGAREGLSTGARCATVNRELAALRRMFRLGRDYKKLLEVPKIELLPEADPREGYLTSDDFRRVLRELPKHLRPVVVLLYYTGMRLREVLDLRWGQINLEHRTIRLPASRHKNKRPKLIKMDGELCQLLDIQQRLRDSRRPGCKHVECDHPECKWAFFGKTGKPIVSPYKAWRSACKQAGVFVTDNEKKRLPFFHDFRRTFATDMRRNGVAEIVIMEMGGWKTRSMFDRYSIVDDADLEDAMRRRKNGESMGKVAAQEGLGATVPPELTQ